MQIMQRIFKLTDMQVLQFFSGQNSQNYDILRAFPPVTDAKLSTLKNSPVYFGPPCRSVVVLVLSLNISWTTNNIR